MNTIGIRLHELRHGAGISQAALAKVAGTNQSAINRYEQDQSAVPFSLLVWYADHFDVSLDCVFCRTDNPHGKYYGYEPDTVKEKLSNKQEWGEFIEACFTSGSPMNVKFKEMFVNMAAESERDNG